jgi:AraC-like DNA-binding protein
LEGRLTYVLDDILIELGPGEVGFIPPNVRHKHISRNGCIQRAIKFEVPYQLGHRTAIVKLGSPSTLLGMLADELFTIGRTLPWQMNMNYFGALLRLLGSATTQGDEHSGSKAYDVVESAKQYALLHLGEPLTLNALASAVHLSASHFSRLFRANVGMSPMEWLWEKRLLQATQLLRDTRMSMLDISAAVGYADVATFSKAFKRWIGMTPTVYRFRAEEVNLSRIWNKNVFSTS